MVSFYKANKPRSSSKSKDTPLFLTVKIDTVNAQGQGLCLSHKPIIAISDGLPGETLKIKITKKRKHIWHAHSVDSEIHNVHPERKIPFCKWVTQCGGCSTQHCGPTAMLRLKQQALDGQISRQLKLGALPWTAPVVSDNQAYRRKARLAVDARNKQAIKVGFRSANSSQIIDISACAILTPDLQNTMNLLHAVIHKEGSSQCGAYQALRFVGHITLMQLPEYNNECSISVHCVKSLSHDAMQWWANFAEKIRTDVDSKARVILYLKEKTLRIFGSTKDDETEKHTQRDVKPNSSDFIQVNASVNSKMLDLACKAMSDAKSDKSSDPILELYSGMGNFTWPLSKLSNKVLAIEGSQAMTEKAQRIAQTLGINHVLHECRNLNDPRGIEDLLKNKKHKVLLDPSRDGAWAVCQQLNIQVASKIVYISCNPQTWLRDAKVLIDNGFLLSSLTLMDMFPYTPHTELFSVFSHS